LHVDGLNTVYTVSKYFRTTTAKLNIVTNTDRKVLVDICIVMLKNATC